MEQTQNEFSKLNFSFPKFHVFFFFNEDTETKKCGRVYTSESQYKCLEI